MWSKVERRKIEMNKFRLYYICAWKYHKETPCLAILNQKRLFLFSFTKIENGKVE
jgi:hypothetical protein